MTNFIFKSQEATYKKLANNIEAILNEQRHQRQDLAALLYLIKMMRNDLSLEKSADDFLDSSDSASPKESERDLD